MEAFMCDKCGDFTAGEPKDKILVHRERVGDDMHYAVLSWGIIPDTVYGVSTMSLEWDDQTILDQLERSSEHIDLCDDCIKRLVKKVGGEANGRS